MTTAVDFYVAETDEAGRVVALWCKSAQSRIARPIRRYDLKLSDLDTKECFGAAREKLADWLAQA
ncbi:hypothetical protein [Yoonia sp.]|uniref:hypothetical protein n=1 Tax=Yoonia sp. TaxID=2212373 RepID=UPI003976777A